MQTQVFQILRVLETAGCHVSARRIAESLGFAGVAPVMPFLTRMAGDGLIDYKNGTYGLQKSADFGETINRAGLFSRQIEESGVPVFDRVNNPLDDVEVDQFEEVVEHEDPTGFFQSVKDYERVVSDGGISPEAFEVVFDESSKSDDAAFEDENGVRWTLDDAGYWLPQIAEVRKAASKGGYWRTTKNGHRIYIEGGKITKGNPYLMKVVAAGTKKKRVRESWDEDDSTVESVDDHEVLKAVFLAGGSGSGKSFVAQKAFGGTGLRVVNNDEAFEFLLKKARIDLKTDTGSPQAQALRPAAKSMTQKKQAGYVTGRLGLLIDGTGDEYEKIVRKKRDLEELGYDTSMLFVDVPLEVAKQRNATRDRVVPDKVLLAAHAGAQEAKEKYRALFGAERFVEYENSQALSQAEIVKTMTPQLVRLVRKLISGPVQNPIGREWVKLQLSPSELATHPALSESTDLPSLAKEIRADWKSMPREVSSLVKEFEGREGSFWAIAAVRYFLAQSRAWTGETADRVKGQLRKFLSESVEEADDASDLDSTYASWRSAVNMSASELKAWSNSPCSRKASIKASAVIERNLELLETPKSDWDARLIKNAKRTISFIARMKNMEQGETVSEECKISKRDISLKNWAYDPSKGANESVEDGIGSNQYAIDIRVGSRVRFVTGAGSSYGAGTTGTVIGRNAARGLWVVRDDAGGIEEWAPMDLFPEVQPPDFDARTQDDLDATDATDESDISEWGVGDHRARVRTAQQGRDRVRFAGSRGKDDKKSNEPEDEETEDDEVEERTVSATVGGFEAEPLGAEDEEELDDEADADIEPDAEFGEAYWAAGLKSDKLPRFSDADGEDEEDAEAEVVIEAASSGVKVWPKNRDDYTKIIADYNKALMDRKNAVSLNASRRMRKLETVPVPELPPKPLFPFAFDDGTYLGMLDADFEGLSSEEIAKQLARAGSEIEGKVLVRWLHHASEALDEVSPPGFKGTVKAMKRAQARGEIPADSNVFALAWAMKKRGAEAHYSSKAPFKKKQEAEEANANAILEWKNDGEGDCMEAAGKYLLHEGPDNPTLRLVHAFVSGQGALAGRRFAHAWILDGNTVIDPSNGRMIQMSRVMYYSIGEVDEKQVDPVGYVEYTFKELVKKLQKYKHWGPWDLDPKLEMTKATVSTKPKAIRTKPAFEAPMEEGIPTSVRQIGKMRKRLNPEDAVTVEFGDDEPEVLEYEYAGTRQGSKRNAQNLDDISDPEVGDVWQGASGEAEVTKILKGRDGLIVYYKIKGSSRERIKSMRMFKTWFEPQMATTAESVRVEDSQLQEFAKAAKQLGVPLTTELEQQDDGSWLVMLEPSIASAIQSELS